MEAAVSLKPKNNAYNMSVIKILYQKNFLRKLLILAVMYY